MSGTAEYVDGGGKKGLTQTFCMLLVHLALTHWQRLSFRAAAVAAAGVALDVGWVLSVGEVDEAVEGPVAVVSEGSGYETDNGEDDEEGVRVKRGWMRMVKMMKEM